nr:hypothetical protein [Streptococcus catagoni]
MLTSKQKVTLNHLVSMEALTNEEVMGLIIRGSEFKAKKAKLDYK